MEAFRQGKARDIAQFYADKALIVGPRGQRFAGREAIEAYWTSFLTAGDWHLRVLEFDSDGTTAYQVARSEFRHRFGDAEYTGEVDVILIWRRQADGSYRIYVDCYL
jgi:ketosteroid isomerase-like protein